MTDIESSDTELRDLKKQCGELASLLFACNLINPEILVPTLILLTKVQVYKSSLKNHRTHAVDDSRRS